MMRLSKKALGTVVGVTAGLTLVSGNLQTFVLGATEITENTARLEANTKYTVNSAEGFSKFGDLVNNGKADSKAKIALTVDIDLTEGGTYESGYCDKPIFDENGKLVGWETRGKSTPIGNREHPFTSKFDGCGHEVKLMMNMERPTGVGVVAGVFGWTGEGGCIMDLGVANGSCISITVDGGQDNFAGGIAGFVGKGGTISRCCNEGSVSVTVRGGYRGVHVGGIAGFVCGEISACSNEGDISEAVSGGGIGCASAGGIAGFVSRGTISICCNRGDVLVTASNDENVSAEGIMGFVYKGVAYGSSNLGAVRVIVDGSAGGH